MSSTRFACWRLAAVAVMAVVPLGACTENDVIAAVCIDYAYFETPADAVEDADAVVLGRVTGKTGTGNFDGVDAAIYTVDVDQWVEPGTGHGAERPDQLEVMSLPRTCEDPKDALEDAIGGHPLYLFLRETDGGWETLTPFHGQIAPDESGGIPSRWPDDIYE